MTIRFATPEECRTRFVAYFHYTGDSLSLGISLGLYKPNINLEIHVPGGFFRIGWAGLTPPNVSDRFKTWGYNAK